MVIIMDMATGKRQSVGAVVPATKGFGAYRDEVLNAGWLPVVEARLETRATADAMPAAGIEPEEFLRNIYRCQE